MIFSILIANYNNERYIAQCLQSVISQSYIEWEIIIVDDNSTDNSASVISNYLNDPRIKFYKNDVNEGCGATKRKCAQMATGDVFCELDPDDAIDLSTLEKLNSIYRDNKKIGFVYTNYYECDTNLKVLKIAKWPSQMLPGETNMFFPKSSALRTFRRTAYEKTEGYDAFFKKAVDKDIVYKIEEITKSTFINEPLYYYRMHDKNISLGKNIFLANIWDIKAKYNTYKRRQGTNIPNLNKKEILSNIWAALFLSLLIIDFNGVRYFKKELSAIQGSILSLLGGIIIFIKVIKYYFFRVF